MQVNKFSNIVSLIRLFQPQIVASGTTYNILYLLESIL